MRALILCSLLALPGFAQDETLDFQKAAALRSKADYSAAASAFEAWLEAYPESARVPEVLVQAGVTRLEAGQAQQMLHRNPPAGVEHLTRALAHLERVTQEFRKSAHAARAQYIASSAYLELGDLPAALDAAEQGLSTFGADGRYAPKALLRRAELRHHLLQPELALADYQRWKRENPRPAADAEGAKVELALEYLPKLAHAAPPLEVVGVRGAPPRLDALQGKVAALLFFDVECHNCPKELPFLRELERRFGPRGLAFVALANGKKGARPEDVAAYADQHGMGWPVGLDVGRTFDAYAAEMSPNLVLVDRRGVARWHEHPGRLCDATLEALLAEPADADSRPAR